MSATKPNFSYSRLEQYENCSLCYDFKYNQKMFFDGESLITALGTLVHDCEEHVSLALKEGKSPNYDDLIDRLYNVNIPKKNPFDTEGGIFGINILKSKWTAEWYEPSQKTGLSYHSKVENYIKNIHRQEEFMLAHPELEIFDVEHPFKFEYAGHTMKGFIDRILKYKSEDRYIIHDIKTKDRLFDKTASTTPLQFTVYGAALKQELGLEVEPDECYWDLVFIQEMQQAGTKGFIKRGYKKLDKIFAGIEAGEYAPKPSPLCYWCSFSETNPNVTEQGRFVCPYHSKWTPDNPDFGKKFDWAGPEMIEEHQAMLKASSTVKSYGGFEL